MKVSDKKEKKSGEKTRRYTSQRNLKKNLNE